MCHFMGIKNDLYYQLQLRIKYKGGEFVEWISQTGSATDDAM